MTPDEIRELLLHRRTDEQERAISAPERQLLVVAGAGSGKTEVMARRIAWWVGIENVDKSSIVAFTFGESAAEEMKFRIRRWIGRITPDDEDPTLGGMYVGTIHGFCLKTLREIRPDRYHNYEIIDDAARIALVLRGSAYYHLLGLSGLNTALGRARGRDVGQYRTIEFFLRGYDVLNEYGLLRVRLPPGPAPAGYRGGGEQEWCREAELTTDLGTGNVVEAFRVSAARYYAYLHCRRFLDFSTSQMELVNLLRDEEETLEELRDRYSHVVVDEVQDINEVQYEVIRSLVGGAGTLTAVGDHRQAIYGWRGSRVEIMGRLNDEIGAAPDGRVERLTANFRSTPRIVRVANDWADTIDPVGNMAHPPMAHALDRRIDRHATHVGHRRFADHQEEAEWIAARIGDLVQPDAGTGAAHDTEDGERGLTYGDMAILLRSSTSARTYMEILQRHGIPAVFQAGPDLFSQPEVMLFVAAMARMAGLDRFYGTPRRPQSFPGRIAQVLGCDPRPEPVIRASVRALRRQGLPVEPDLDDRLARVSNLVHIRMYERESADPRDVADVENPALRTFLTSEGGVPRVFPQDLYQWLLSEAGVPDWDLELPGRAQTALFHLGQLSSLIREVESPGWTSPGDFRAQMITLSQWGAENARTSEAPLLVPPVAVTISTIHKAKGLQFAAVFMADVRAQRFPSRLASHRPELPYSRDIVDPADLADNQNRDAERRLMYVALTRAERFLFVTSSGDRRSSFFIRVTGIVDQRGGTEFGDGRPPNPVDLGAERSAPSVEQELVTSFSDLRYFLECPHDFYLRKVLGFAPGIDRAIGYGQGIHNLLRAVHSDPEAWVELVEDPEALRDRLKEMADRGLFYLRYTTGEPAEAMRARALDLVARYVTEYVEELRSMGFEPERDFETLVEEENVLVGGSIDLVRLEDPPRVSLLDFKSGEAESNVPQSLDSELMRLQVKIYGLAARQELEYEPERGLVRYLAEEDPARQELEVTLDDEALTEAKEVVMESARRIRARSFHDGPTGYGGVEDATDRCAACDFIEICGLDSARAAREGRG